MTGQPDEKRAVNDDVFDDVVGRDGTARPGMWSCGWTIISSKDLEKEQ